MYIRKFLKWTLVLLAFVAYKNADWSDGQPRNTEVVYTTQIEG